MAWIKSNPALHSWHTQQEHAGTFRAHSKLPLLTILLSQKQEMNTKLLLHLSGGMQVGVLTVSTLSCIPND